MAALPPSSIDLIVTDPPYEIPDLRPYFEQMLRVLKPTGSLYCFGDKNMVAEHWFSQLAMPHKTVLAWHYKNSPKPRGRWRMSFQSIIYGYNAEAPFYEDEVRVEYTEGAKKLHGRARPSGGRLQELKPYDTSKGALPRDVIEVPALLGHRANVRFGHPDQKPIELIERLIRASSKTGDMVLDPFGGTGTTAVAAQNLGRNCIMFELAPRWVSVARGRLKSALKCL